ncbi:MAG: PKD domain-containing protein [Deltaproteobacteria bacterium]|nr:PKD domain-containing protein [Deltaproteobacteria bacterium]
MFDIPTAGYYKIKAWWAASQTRSNNAPYTVYHSNPITFDNVSTTIQVNQRLNGEQWNELGEFFFDIGEYSVILTDDTTTGNVVGDAIRLEHVDNPPEVLSADFNARVRSGVAPLEVTFDSENVGEVSALFWDFGDGDTNSTRDYITHIYDQPGTYTVSFTVYGPLGSDTVTKTDYIVVGADSNPGPILRAEFRAISAQEGLAPFEARFGDRSSGDIVSWLWYFGDGYTSEEQNPTHIYETTGNYTATLTVIDSDGSTSTETKPNFIRVSLFDKTIDNVDYPKTHYRSKTLLFVNDLDIDPNDFKYSRLLYVGCDSGHYFTDTFKRGKMFYSLNTSSTGPLPLLVYLRSYLEGKKDYEVWQDLQSLDPIFDYYYFDRPPFEQPVD